MSLGNKPNTQGALTMEQKHRDNLEKLGRYLAKLSAKHNKEHFEMRSFFSHNQNSISPEEAPRVVHKHFCGTIACAVGHVPLALPEEFAKALSVLGGCGDRSLWGYQWGDISAEVLGIDFFSCTFDFLFGPEWSYMDNAYDTTSWAVADRIAWYLENDFRLREPDTEEWIGYAAKRGWISDSLHNLHLVRAEKVRRTCLTSW